MAAQSMLAYRYSNSEWGIVAGAEPSRTRALVGGRRDSLVSFSLTLPSQQKEANGGEPGVMSAQPIRNVKTMGPHHPYEVLASRGAFQCSVLLSGFA